MKVKNNDHMDTMKNHQKDWKVIVFKLLPFDARKGG